MADPRIRTLAEKLVHHSLNIKSGENVLIEAFDEHGQVVTELVREVYAAGALPHVVLRSYTVDAALMRSASESQLILDSQLDAARLGRMDCYIGIDARKNLSETATLASDKVGLYARTYKRPVNAALLKTRWVESRYPSPGSAQAAGMGTEEFEDFFFRVTTLDYEKLGRLSAPLAKRMHEADKVRVLAPGTDLTLSLKGFTALVADGRRNMPDGEVASTPARESMNGVVAFNIPSFRNGFLHKNIRIVFKNGRVEEATADDTERFLKDLDVDDNARFVGEFSFGTNPLLTRHINDTMFDEKMTGSFHMALGCCYNFPGRDNGNYSAIHWDLIQSHRSEYGGGEVWLDGELIRRDGLYLPEDLKPLNPDRF